MLPRTGLFLAAVAATLALSAAHNWLTRPHAFNRNFPTRDCKGSECQNACPPLLLPARMYNTVDRPAATWRRGQSVEMSWARNNHHGGLMRAALVPVPVMNDRRMHTKFTLFHGCFEAGRYECKKARHPCGTDPKWAFKRRFTVPRTMVDGNYVLGYVWYGGLHFKKKRGQFPDFFSCAFIRIRGGPSPAGSHKPTWSPGNGRNIRNGRCLTAASSVGVCGRTGCSSRRAFWSRSRIFLGGGPKAFTVNDIRNAFKVKNGDVNLVSGNCKGKVCCKRECRGCGGPRCHLQRGGARACCTGAIERAGKSCKRNPPPCVRD